MKSKQFFAGILISSILLTAASGCTKKSKPASDISTIEQKSSGNAIYELASGNSSKTDDAELQRAYSEFSVGLIRHCAGNAGNESFLVSSDSVLLALEMTAAGADRETLDQMLGTLLPGVPKEDAFLFAVDRMDQIESDQLKIANSIWINDAAQGAIYDNYLKYVEKHFDAHFGAIPFNSSGVDTINSWVKDNTDGMIDKLVKELESDDVMVLVNALAFDAKWKKPFEEENIEDMTFHCLDGIQEDCRFLCGEKDVVYLHNEKSTGFYKLYEGGKYAFMVMLPGAPEPDFLTYEDLTSGDSKADQDDSFTYDINTFIANMTAKDYWQFWNSANQDDVEYAFPEFTSEYDTSLRDILIDMGMADAFDPAKANFSNMSNLTPLNIADVIHKTRIEVTAEGTKAAAATGVVMEHNSIIMTRKVICDRPFAYAIVDTETGLPIFFGTVTHVK